MSLRIVPDGCDRLKQYYPGEPVTGQVIATFTKQQRLSLATISFRGKIATEYVEGRHGTAGNTHGPRKRAEETIRLFEVRQELFKGPYDVPPQTFEWRFSFTIPTHCEHHRVGNKSPGFIPDGVSPLPPSFGWGDNTFTHDAKARVKFKLVATIDSGGLFKNHEVELPINVVRFATSPMTKPQLLRHEYRPSPQWSSRELRQQSHSLVQKFKHMTSDDPQLKTPCISFRAYVHFPIQLAPDQPTPIGFSILHFRVTPNDPETPELTLDSLALTLKSHTAMTAAAPGSRFQADRLAENKAPEASHVVRFDPTVLPLDGKEVWVGQETCLDEWRSQWRLIGDFATYTIKRDHRMKVEAVVRHPVTGHCFQMKTEFPFCVLDRYNSNVILGIQRGGAPGSSRRAEGQHEVDPELPPYSADDRPPEHEDAGVAAKA